MASSSHNDFSSGKRKRAINYEMVAIPAPKRPSRPFQRDLPALPAPSTSSQARSQLLESGEWLFELNILLPDGNNVIMHEKVDNGLTVAKLVLKVRQRARKGDAVMWGSHVYLEDTDGNRVEDGHIFDCEEPRRILFLQDGGRHSIHSLQDMWNVTPDPELLVSLPQEYTVETALADLLDNSLQAVWANSRGDSRNISVKLSSNTITIFDSGPGMDSTTENSIAKWGTMGSSKHRNLRVSAIGGKPPFLQPYFGMYGFGGLTAALHLGSVVVVSSKTKLSKKVVSLTLEREKLMERCKADRTWKTAGEYRDPTDEEMKESPHGSFTKVELSKLKQESVLIEKQVMCMLKDIYFPYIQCDAVDSCCQGTMTPVEFQVNGINLTEVDGGEVALTNMCSCNGGPFILDINMNRTTQHSDPCLVNELDRATARISCSYFPIKGGKETIDALLEELLEAGYGVNETFDNFCRVSIRRLGRLLPDARWARLPFMEPKRKRGDKDGLPKICFERVKASVDTDAGFVPTTSKMDLLSGHAFTSFLKNLGTRGKIPEDVRFEIYRGTRRLKLQDVEKEYQEWLHEMHDAYDEEMEIENKQCVIAMQKADELGFSLDVYRIYTSMSRKGSLWKQGMKVRFSKGIPGYKTKELYATLEFFVSEGLQEDKGNTKMICRPMNIPKAEGSRVLIENGAAMLDLRKSKTIPIDFLNSSEKCDIVPEKDWMRIYENKQLKEPGEIYILDKKSIQSLGLEGGISSIVRAGIRPLDNIFAVIRPKSFSKLMQEGKISNPLDQRNIVKTSMLMKMQMTQPSVLNLNTSEMSKEEDMGVGSSVTSAQQCFNNIHGIYCFSLQKAEFEMFYTKAGKYILVFCLMDEESENVVLETSIQVEVLPSDKSCRWMLKYLNESDAPSARMGSTMGPLLVNCLDEYENKKDIDWPSDSSFEIWSRGNRLEISLLVESIVQVENKKTAMIVEALSLHGGTLEGIAEDYLATLQLVIGGRSEASLQIRVLPGQTSLIRELCMDDLDNSLQTGDIIHTMTLEVMDSFGNHVERGCEIFFQLENLEFQDSQGCNRLVDDKGCIRLGGLLRVTGPFNSKANISAYTKSMKRIYLNEFNLKRRRLEVVSEVPEECAMGGVLHNVAIEVVDENGMIDRKITAAQDFITVSGAEQAVYPLKEGICCIKSLQLPDQLGTCSFHIHHVLYPELEAKIQVNLVTNVEGSAVCLDSFESNQETRTLPIDESCSQNDLPLPILSVIQHLQVLKNKMVHLLPKIQKAEDELDRMLAQKKTEEDKMLQLEGAIKCLQRQSETLEMTFLNSYEKNDITAGKIAEEISRTSSPAKFILDAFCSDYFGSGEMQDSHLADIMGIVCLLASTKQETLSRALADVIGEDSMLAVVCKTRAASNILIRFDKGDGTIDETYGLYEYITSQKQSMNGKLRMFILEEMEWYNGGIEESDPQKLLKIEEPRLMNGCVPDGFIGFAVNLLHLNDEHLQGSIGCKSNGGLRASLFYSLLKELQVYDTRKHLCQAKDALTAGGISLDGGVIRERGCEDFGWRKTKIMFPLHSKCGKKIPSLRSINSITQRMQIRDSLESKSHDMQECKTRLEQVDCKIDYVRRKIKSKSEKSQKLKEEMQKSKEELDQLKSTMLA